MTKSFTRYFLIYLAGRIVLVLLTTLVFPETGFWNFLQYYRRYLIIVSLSYFTYCYFINETEKTYLQLKTTLLTLNIYLTLHLFFRPLLNIAPELFLLLGLIILGLRAIRKLPSKIKSPLNILGGIASFLILISGIFYLYPDAPDILGFYRQQSTQLILQSPTSLPKHLAYIQITDLTTQKPQTTLFQTGISTLPLPSQFQIQFISTTPDTNAQFFVMFPDASLLQIHPQTNVIVADNAPDGRKTIQSEIGTLSRFRPPRTGLIDGLYWVGIQDWEIPPLMEKETYENTTVFYRNNLKSYLIQQIGSPLLVNPTIQTINKTVLSLLTKAFPGFFSQNIKNYETFHYYFNLITPETTTIHTNKYSLSETKNPDFNLRESIKNNIKLALPNLRIF